MSIEGLSRLNVWVRAKSFVLAIYKLVLPLQPLNEPDASSSVREETTSSIVDSPEDPTDTNDTALKSSTL